MSWNVLILSCFSKKGFNASISSFSQTIHLKRECTSKINYTLTTLVSMSKSLIKRKAIEKESAKLDFSQNYLI